MSINRKLKNSHHSKTTIYHIQNILLKFLVLTIIFKLQQNNKIYFIEN